jgi:alcohol dehydrogenase class IV
VSLATALDSGRVMIVSDAGCRSAGILDVVLDALLPRRPVAIADFLTFEPDADDVERVRAVIAAERPDCLVAVGGGSAIDLAKAAAALAANGGSIRDYVNPSYADYELDSLAVDPLPVVAVPTTAGTGSEVTRNAAISDPATGEKLALRSPRLVPKTQFLDPNLLRTCPGTVVAQSGVDAAAHALEGLMSTLASPVSDSLAVDAVRRLVMTLPDFYRDPANPRLAMQMQTGSLMAGVVLNSCATVAAHGLSRAIGGAAKLPHGLSVAIVIAEVVRFNAGHADDGLRQVASALHLAGDRPADAIASALETLRDTLNIPARLREVGVSRGDLAAIAAMAAQFAELNPRPAGPEELLDILEKVF